MHHHEHEAVIIQRDVEAIMVPAGVPVTLRADKTGFITQALGGSFTVYVEGNLFRIAGKDADALDRKLRSVLSCPRTPLMMMSRNSSGPDACVLRSGDSDHSWNWLVYSCELTHEPDIAGSQVFK